MSDITVLLNGLASDDSHAAAELLPLVYNELRQLAAHWLAHEAPGQTLDPTALVHEAYLRLVGEARGQDWQGRNHFFAVAAEAMRRILVENARRKRRIKHGGAMVRRELAEAELLAPEPREDLLALDEALKLLASTDRTAANLVQLRYFGGLSVADAAQALGLSVRSAGRIWTHTRVWLLDQITNAGRGDDPS
jgi:RNA polymerase sigma factor (TIGR02999 family)